MIERRECQAVVLVNEDEGYYKVCGAHVRETLIPGLYWCSVCGRHSRRGHTKETERPQEATQ